MWPKIRRQNFKLEVILDDKEVNPVFQPADQETSTSLWCTEQIKSKRITRAELSESAE